MSRRSPLTILLEDFATVVNNQEYTIERIRRWIMSYYLTRRKPIPTQKSLKLYSDSIFDIIQLNNQDISANTINTAPEAPPGIP